MPAASGPALPCESSPDALHGCDRLRGRAFVDAIGGQQQVFGRAAIVHTPGRRTERTTRSFRGRPYMAFAELGLRGAAGLYFHRWFRSLHGQRGAKHVGFLDQRRAMHETFQEREHAELVDVPANAPGALMNRRERGGHE